MYLSLVQLLCYCIGYTSNNDWSTSIIPLDQYQEKLQERRREWEASQPLIDRLTRILQERERELQEEKREKEQVRTRLQQQLQEREREIQQGREREQDLQRQGRQLQEREKQAGEREQDLQQQLQSINSIYNTGISGELSNIVDLVIKFVILFHFASVILPIVIIETSNIIPAYNIFLLK